MILSGKLKSINLDISNSKYLIELELNEKKLDLLQELMKKDKLSIELKQYKEKRSLDANAYFHVLVTKIAQALTPPISVARAKNILICRYGQFLLNKDNSPVVLKANIDTETMLEQETIHCMPCGEKCENGTNTTFYRVYRGSHTYDTKEMSILIDGTVEEAKALGIDTLTSQQLKEMIERWQLKG